MLTGDGNALGASSTTVDSVCVAPVPTVTVIAPASAALSTGIVLTVDCTFACALAAPVRSAELESATRHEGSNRMMVDTGTPNESEAKAGTRSLSALASLLHGEVRESKDELLGRRVFGPRDLESALAMREQRERTAGNRLLAIHTHLAAQHAA